MDQFLKISGIQIRKKDGITFLIGMLLPVSLVFLIFLYLKSKGNLNDVNYWELLLSGKKKLIYYFFIGFVEEFIFRGLLFGFLWKKGKNMFVNILSSAFIFAVPHAVNANAPVHVLLLFSFIFGILACEMRYFTGSIWMSTAFHWTWNYSVVSVFMATDTNQLIYRYIVIAVFILALCFYLLIRREKAER